MRHNKLAGTRFLLGSRKHKPSTFTSSSTSKNTSDITTDCNCGNMNTSTTNNNMLHSKSTYFYRWFSEHLDLVVSGLSTKNTKNTNKASKASYLVPAVCGAALLGTLGFIVSPAAGKAEAVYAVSDDECQTTANDQGICAMELGIMMNGTNDAFNEVPATKLSTTEATFRDYDFMVRAVDTKDGYKLYANALGSTGADGTDYTNKLVNMDDPEGSVITALTSEAVGSNIPAGQWGYAFTKGDDLTTAPDTLTYKAVPSGTTETSQPIDTGADTIYDKTSNTHTDMNYKLYFGAKASDGMRSGHYKTQVQLSLVADPKVVVMSMQKFAEAGACSGMTTNEARRLVDDRRASGVAELKTYWITKIGAQCMMTQNLDLDIPASGLKAADTDLTVDWTTGVVATLNDGEFVWVDNSNGIAQSYNPGEYVINQATSSWDSCTATKDPSACDRYTAITDDTPGVDLHYAVGNYYNWYAATAGTGGTLANGDASGSICPKGWQLLANSGAKSFQTVFSGKNQTTIRESPAYLPTAGLANSSGIYGAGYGGYYWSSTRTYNVGSAYNLSFSGGGFNLQATSDRYSGYSIRCIAK